VAAADTDLMERIPMKTVFRGKRVWLRFGAALAVTAGSLAAGPHAAAAPTDAVVQIEALTNPAASQAAKADGTGQCFQARQTISVRACLPAESAKQSFRITLVGYDDHGRRIIFMRSTFDSSLCVGRGDGTSSFDIDQLRFYVCASKVSAIHWRVVLSPNGVKARFVNLLQGPTLCDPVSGCMQSDCLTTNSRVGGCYQTTNTSPFWRSRRGL
jgi:hypothetical protein